MELTRRTGTSNVVAVAAAFCPEGIAGLSRDKTRPSRIPPLGREVEAGVLAATQTAAPGETTHWTSVAMARQIGISVSSEQRIWRKHGLQPHRVRGMPWSSIDEKSRHRARALGFRNQPLHPLQRFPTFPPAASSTEFSVSVCSRYLPPEPHLRGDGKDA